MSQKTSQISSFRIVVTLDVYFFQFKEKYVSFFVDQKKRDTEDTESKK